MKILVNTYENENTYCPNHLYWKSAQTNSGRDKFCEHLEIFQEAIFKLKNHSFTKHVRLFFSYILETLTGKNVFASFDSSGVFLTEDLSSYENDTAWKVSKQGVFSGPYFHVFSPNTGKYGPEITPHLDTFHAVELTLK